MSRLRRGRRPVPQRVYVAPPTWRIVITRIADSAANPGEEWEAELTGEGQPDRLYYHRSRRAALRHLRHLIGAKPRRIY